MTTADVNLDCNLFPCLFTLHPVSIHSIHSLVSLLSVDKILDSVLSFFGITVLMTLLTTDVSNTTGRHESSLTLSSLSM